MQEERRTYRLYEEWVKGGKRFTQLTGEFQYIFSSEKGVISLVQFINYFGDGKNFWEIYCLEGNLFEGTERFPTQEIARMRIKELLEE
jgi:hypothetical protein